MRKIENKMIQAIKSKSCFSLDNTRVDYVASENISEIFLHNNLIAYYKHDDDSMYISSCGWESNTTKSRLNALLDTFFYGVGIFQKNWQWFISDRRDNKTVKQIKWFYDGMIVYNNGLSSMETHPLVA